MSIYIPPTAIRELRDLTRGWSRYVLIPAPGTVAALGNWSTSRCHDAIRPDRPLDVATGDPQGVKKARVASRGDIATEVVQVWRA